MGKFGCANTTSIDIIISQSNSFEVVNGTVKITNSDQNTFISNMTNLSVRRGEWQYQHISSEAKREGPSQTSQSPKKLKSEHPDEIDELFNPPRMNFDSLPIVVDPLLSQDVLENLKDIVPYKCEGVEYGKFFVAYKIRSFQQLSSMDRIYLEPNFYKLIALEHVLFLKPGSYSSDMIDIFGENNLNKLYKHFVKKHFNYQSTEQEALLQPSKKQLHRLPFISAVILI